MVILVAIIIFYGLLRRNNIFDSFVSGAKESVNIIINLFPNLLAMILAVNVFMSSGILNNIKIFQIPQEIIGLMLLKPFSGSAALAFLNNILNTYGPDSFVGVLASVIAGSTDTTFYILAVYFGANNITKTRYALLNGLLADIFAFVISFMFVSLLYNCFF